MMTTITGIMEWVLENIAGFAIVIFEFIGVAIIIWSGITGFIKWLKHAGRYWCLSGEGTCHGTGI